MKNLSIIVLCYNKYNFTKSCLSDLSKLPETVELIFFDNGSTDETQKELQHNPRIKYIRSDVNLGFAAGCNKSYQVANSSNILFLNNDIRVKNNDDWTLPIIDELNKNEPVLIGPTMGQLDNNFNFIQEANKVLTGNVYMSGWCLAGTKTTFNKLIEPPSQGPFCEDYFVYFDDTHMGFLSRKLGIQFKIIEVPIVHFGKVSSKQLNTHQLYQQARKIFISKWKSQ